MKFKLLESSNYVMLDESKITSPEILLKWMDKNIDYFLANDEYIEDSSEPFTQTAKELIKSKQGHCAEQSYLEKYVLDKLGYTTELWFVKENSVKNDYKYEGSAHVFIIFKENSKYVWFEHAMEHAKGIHKFNSMRELINNVAENWWRYTKQSDILEFRKLDKPITGVTNLELAKECYKKPLRYIIDISDNVLEKDM